MCIRHSDTMIPPTKKEAQTQKKLKKKKEFIFWLFLFENCVFNPTISPIYVYRLLILVK